MKPELLMMGPMSPRTTAAIEAAFTVHRYWAAGDGAALLAAVGPRIRAVATDGQLGCPPAVLDHLPGVEMIASYGVGYDNIPVAAVRARGARVSNTPDVLNDAVAELTIGLMVALCRRIVAGDAFVRAGDWAHRPFGLTGELTGRTVGILGLGRIGAEIARRCVAMKMQVIYHARNPRPDAPYPYHADLTAMARAADWLVVIAPGTAETRGIVSRAVLEALGPDGAVVNVARGALVDEAAMVDLLATGALGGAALDVFEDEPRPHPGLLGLPNVVLSPHQGSATERTRAAMGDLVVANLMAWRDGRPLLSEVLG